MGRATSRQAALFEDYDGFCEKFKPKKTTDDCMTPPEVYDEVLAYCAERWGIDPARAVRPFWPGGDFEAFDYPEGCVVVDNPPFSILARIQESYLRRGIPFFLFAPALTCLSGRRCMEVDHIVCGFECTYENGAVVRTAFVTSLEPRFVLEADPALGERLDAAMARALAKNKAPALPKYEYPPHLLTAARAGWLASHGTVLRVRRSDACRVGALDEQRACGKSVFGGGLLLSDRAAADRAAAERAAADRAAAERAAAERAAADRAAADRAAAHVWGLSERERAVVALLGRNAQRLEEREEEPE